MDMFFSECNFSNVFYFLLPRVLELLNTNTVVGKVKWKHGN